MSTILTLGGLVLAAVTVLYIMKLRKRRIQVPFSPLWKQVLTEKKQSSDFWKRLRRLFSWFVHVLLACLLAFALADPHFETEVVQGRHILLLVDSSASMASTDVSGGVDRLDIAKQKAREILDTIGPEDRVMLVEFNNQLRPLSPFVAEASVLEQPLRDISVVATGTSYSEALRFAADSLRDKERGELILISDGSGLKAESIEGFDLGDGVTLRHLKVGEASGNLAVTAFNVRRYLANKLDYELFVRVTSSFDRPVNAEIEIYADGRLVDTKPIQLDANDAYQRFYPSQAVSGERLEARVRLKTTDARDVFPLDDRAYALLPPTRKTTVMVVTEGNLYLEGPLLLNPNLDVTRVTLENYSPEKAASFDVTIFDRVAPKPPATGGLLYFGPPAGEFTPWETTKQVPDPIITRTKKSHPLMRWISLADVNIGVADQWKLRGGDTVVASSALGLPLLVARQEEDRKVVGVAFDVRNSDLPLRVAFPVFLLNAIDFFSLDDPSLVETNQTGKTWSVPMKTESARVDVTYPDGSTASVPVYDGRAVVYGEQTGFYRIASPEVTKTVAANLADNQESKIAPEELNLDKVEIKRDTSALIFDRHDLWIWALLAVLLMLMIEWWTYNRRLTV